MTLFFNYESVVQAMQLTVRDASALLKLPEKTLYRFIKRNEIPFYRLNNHCFFNRAELLEWAIARSIDVSPDFFGKETHAEQLPLLSAAITTGGVYKIAESRTKSEVLQKIVSFIPRLTTSEKELIFKALMARETLGSTAIGNGIAIPHVRNPIILNIKGPSILLCFLESPIDFGALDGKKVSTIFTMISPTARIHLHLLARLSYVLQNKSVRNMLTPAHDSAKILSCISDVENNIPLKTTGTAQK
jgi:PTS system nitrogen regulatory IIA component